MNRGDVVRFYAGGGWNRGIVLRQQPTDAYSRAYGTQYDVLNAQHACVQSVGGGDMVYLGRVQWMPRLGVVVDPPHPDEVRHHERIRDIRRVGQGASYDPNAEHNRWAEMPHPGHKRNVVLRAKRGDAP